MSLAIARVAFVALAAIVGAAVSGPLGAGIAAACALAVVLAERALRAASSSALIGAAAGVVLGLLAALLAGELVLPRLPQASGGLVSCLLALSFAWLGGALGVRAAVGLGLAGGKPGGVPEKRRGATTGAPKVLDTSVIIDGRIVDIIEAGFLEGTVVIPQFVLRELQHVADSSDGLKRNRGRKGLDALKAIQKSARVSIELTDQDTPDVRDVDGKLLWLAERRGGHVLTNDYNLNKIAQLRGIPVLNVNDLANAMKPVVLPGETLQVQVIKEGKERNQGVGYLDDGTMVVVENGRRHIGQRVDAVVTSVIQTNAGKMIFGTAGDEEALAPETRHRALRRADGPVVPMGSARIAEPQVPMGQG